MSQSSLFCFFFFGKNVKKCDFFPLLYFYWTSSSLIFVSVLLNFVSTPSRFSQCGVLLQKAALVGGLILRIHMIQTAPAFSRTYPTLTCVWIGINLFNFQGSLLKLAIILSSKYLRTILMFLSPSNTQLLPYASSCKVADFMQVLWLLMVFPTPILRFLT